MAPKTCIFCDIVQGKDPNATLLFQDETVAVFADHRPAAPHHYLVVPKEHIRDASNLDKSHVDLLKHMMETGNQVLAEQGGTLDDVRMGVHHWPLLLVNHVHLHVISPASNLGFLARWSFRPDSYWFTTAEVLLAELQKKAEDEQS